MFVAVCWMNIHFFWHLRMFSDIQNKAFSILVQLLIDHSAGDVCALLGYYAASIGNFLPTFRDNLSVPSSGVKNHARLFVYIIVWNVMDIRLHMIHWNFLLRILSYQAEPGVFFCCYLQVLLHWHPKERHGVLSVVSWLFKLYFSFSRCPKKKSQNLCKGLRSRISWHRRGWRWLVTVISTFLAPTEWSEPNWAK